MLSAVTFEKKHLLTIAAVGHIFLTATKYEGKRSLKITGLVSGQE